MTILSPPNKTFCMMPFIHLATKPIGTVHPCCKSSHSYTDDTGAPYLLSATTLSEVFASSDIQQLRQMLIAGEHVPSCNECYVEEDAGIESMRLQSMKFANEELTPKLTSVKLKLGATCNLKCRICSPTVSTKWWKEYSTLYPKYKINKQQLLWPDDNIAFWDDLHSIIPTLTKLEVYGGEPLLSKSHYKLLEDSVRSGSSNHLSLGYSTNGTIYPTYAVNEIWPHFENVYLLISVDGIGPRFDYQRHPAKWDIVSNNIARFASSEYLHVKICVTVSSINVYYLPEVLGYCSSQNLPVIINILQSPSYFSIANLPSDAKIIVTDRLATIPELDHVVRLMNNSQSLVDKQALISKLAAHDEYRGESYASVFPEFAAILGVSAR